MLCCLMTQIFKTHPGFAHVAPNPVSSGGNGLEITHCIHAKQQKHGPFYTDAFQFFF